MLPTPCPRRRAEGTLGVMESQGAVNDAGARARYLDLIAGLFVAILLISNMLGQKIWRLGPLDLSAGLLLFPVSYIFGDILTEVYGYARSRRIIWIGFFSNALMAAVGWIAVRLPPAPDWPNQQAFATVMVFVPRVVVASRVAFWAGEFSNS